jgi:DNA-3-methyladenine glycosylase II
MTRCADALKHFKRVDPHFYRMTRAYHSALPAELSGKRTRAQLFESLVATVISQQLGVAAADTIYGRVESICNRPLTSLSIAKIKSEKLRDAGLSGAKIKTLKAVATEIENGTLDLAALKRLPEEKVARKLLSIWGLGPWSVEMFMMFALGRADVFSSGDLGLVRAMEALYGLPKNTPREKLSAISEKWSPYRTYACLLLWRSRDTKAG